MFDELIEKIQQRLNKGSLPGLEIHLQLAPRLRIPEIKDFSLRDNAKKSSVLILLYPYKNSVYLVLTVRQQYAGVHSGQVSLPGGKFEIKDINLTQTALREAKEEIGVDIDKITVIGTLSELYIPPSNFLVLPVVAYTSERPMFKHDTIEVAEIVEIDLNQILSKDSISEKEIFINESIKFKAPCFYINNLVIWGATAMILNEFKHIVKEFIKLETNSDL